MDHTTVTTQQRSSVASSPLARHPLVWYFVLAYTLAWLLWLPYVLSRGGGLGLIPFTTPSVSPIDIGLVPTMLVFLGALGPALAAMIMSAVTGGSAAVWMLLRRMIQVRIGIQWYLFVLFVPLVAPLMIMLPFESGTLVLALVSVKGLLALGIYIVSAFLSIVLGSPIGEEPGWRGFALPRLQERYGPIWGSLVLGLLWACWHLPLFFTGWGKAYAIIGIALGFLLFALLVLGYTFVATWLFNNTRGSIFMAALFHAALNSRSVFFLVLFPEALNEMPDAATVLSSLLILAIAWLLVAGLLLVLTKGKLSYKGPDELVRSGACQKLADESSSLSA